MHMGVPLLLCYEIMKADCSVVFTLKGWPGNWAICCLADMVQSLALVPHLALSHRLRPGGANSASLEVGAERIEESMFSYMSTMETLYEKRWDVYAMLAEIGKLGLHIGKGSHSILL